VHVRIANYRLPWIEPPLFSSHLHFLLSFARIGWPIKIENSIQSIKRVDYSVDFFS